MNARVGTPTIDLAPSITGGAPKVNLSQMLGMDADFLRQARAAVKSADWSLAPAQVKAKADHDRAAELAAARETQLPRERGGRPVVENGQPTHLVDGGLSPDEVQLMHMKTVAEVSTGGLARTEGRVTIASLASAIEDGNAGRARVGQGSGVVEIDRLSRAAGEMLGDSGRSVLGRLEAPFSNRVAERAPESDILIR